MKNIIIPNQELRLLVGQLQNFNQGFTVQQIRSLDKIVMVMEKALEPFTEGLNKILVVESSYTTEKEKQENEAKKQAQLQTFVETEGKKEVICSFSEMELLFIEMVWSKMSTFSGVKEAREAIIKIDDALKTAKDPVFDQKLN